MPPAAAGKKNNIKHSVQADMIPIVIDFSAKEYALRELTVQTVAKKKTYMAVTVWNDITDMFSNRPCIQQALSIPC